MSKESEFLHMAEKINIDVILTTLANNNQIKDAFNIILSLLQKL